MAKRRMMVGAAVGTASLVVLALLAGHYRVRPRLDPAQFQTMRSVFEERLKHGVVSFQWTAAPEVRLLVKHSTNDIAEAHAHAERVAKQFELLHTETGGYLPPLFASYEIDGTANGHTISFTAAGKTYRQEAMERAERASSRAYNRLLDMTGRP